MSFKTKKFQFNCKNDKSQIKKIKFCANIMLYKINLRYLFTKNQSPLLKQLLKFKWKTNLKMILKLQLKRNTSCFQLS